MRLSKIIDSRSRLLLLSGDGVCACAQSRSCYRTQHDCCNAEVTGLRSGRIVCGTIAAAGAAAIGRTAVAAAAVGRIVSAVAAACCGSRSFTCRSGLARICGCAVRIIVLRCLSGRCRISGCSAAAGIDAAYSKVNNNLVSCCQTAGTFGSMSVVFCAVAHVFRMFTRSVLPSSFRNIECSDGPL